MLRLRLYQKKSDPSLCSGSRIPNLDPNIRGLRFSCSCASLCRGLALRVLESRVKGLGFRVREFRPWAHPATPLRMGPA